MIVEHLITVQSAVTVCSLLVIAGSYQVTPFTLHHALLPLHPGVLGEVHREHRRDAAETDQQGDGQGPRSSLQPGGHRGPDYQSLQGIVTGCLRQYIVMAVQL